MSSDWKPPEGGPHGVAIRWKLYGSRQREVDDFFGRPLAKRDHHVVFEQETYVVFSFKHERDADAFLLAFEGEKFDPRDMGSGRNWTRWYKGRTAKRKARRSRYDFS